MGSNWGIAAGIGQGVMQGLQFNRQMEADRRADQALQNQNEVLQMQKQIHGEKMGALNRENEERQRVDTLGNLKTGIETSYQDVPDYKRQQMFVDYGLQTGLMKPADLDAAKKLRDNMIQMAGPEAYQAVLRGDIKPMQQLLGTKGYDIQADAKSGNYLLRMPGSDAVQSIDKAGLLQLDAMATYRDQLAASSKVALDARKTDAEITRTLADANLKDRLPQDRFSLSARGAGKGGKDAVDPAEMFSADTYLERFGVGKDTDPATRARGDDGYGYYQMLHKANPEFSRTRDGNEMFFRLSRDIMNGSVQRDTKFDPSSMSWVRYVTDSQGGRYRLDRGNVDPRQLKGPDGKPAIEPAVIEQEEVSALKKFSTSQPGQYRLAASLAQSKGLTDGELLAAANGQPISAGDRSANLSPALANVALMIRRRGMETPGKLKLAQGGVKRALPDTSGYGAGGWRGTSMAGEAFDQYIADPVVGFFKESARKAREE
jgi:hypothetical protein